MSHYRILSLDGGGIRGYLTILLLERLEEKCPGFLEQIDLFAGASTGSIIALALAHGKSPTEVRKLYERYGRYFHLEDIVLLSLGTGLNPRYISDKDADWGWIK